MIAGLSRLVWRVGALLPLSVSHAVGGRIGWLMMQFAGRLRAVVDANLATCFPERTPAQRQSLAKAVFEETGRTWAEMGPLWHWPWMRVAQLVRAVDGAEHIDAARAAGRGVILALPHLGAWELIGLYVASRYPVTSLYRPPRQAGLEAWMRRSRERNGNRLVPTGAGGVRALLRALNDGEVVCVLPDQEPKRGKGVFAPFFGVPAWTMTLLPRLAQRSGAAVIMAWAERLPGGAGYHLHFEPVGSAISAGAMNAAIEGCVRRAPAQYQWTYKRFRARPPGEPPVY